MTDDPKRRANKEPDPDAFPHGRVYERLRQFEEQRGMEPSEIDEEPEDDRRECVDEPEDGEERVDKTRRRCGDATKDAPGHTDR